MSSVAIVMLSERGMDHGHGADTCKAGQVVMLPSTRRKSTHAVSESASAAFQIGQDPAMFEARPAIDLSNARLRTLPAALDPAYMRVSGTWANSVYFLDSEEPAAKASPPGESARV